MTWQGRSRDSTQAILTDMLLSMESFDCAGKHICHHLQTLPGMLFFIFIFKRQSRHGFVLGIFQDCNFWCIQQA